MAILEIYSVQELKYMLLEILSVTNIGKQDLRVQKLKIIEMLYGHDHT